LVQQGPVRRLRLALDSLTRQRQMRTALTVAVVVLGPVLAVATLVIIGRIDRVSANLLRLILLADFVYVLMVAGLVAQRIAAMVAARRARSAGSQLHLRLAGVFAFVAMIPTILVAVFATLTVNFGLEGWFSDRVQRVVVNSLEAAEAYEAEHRTNLSFDAELLARFLNDQKLRQPMITPAEFRELLNRGQVQMQRELREAYVIDGTGEIAARGERSYLFGFEKPLPEHIATARAGNTVIIKDEANNEFRALVALPAFADRLLYVTREVDGEILRLLDDTQETVQLYQQLERDRGRLLFEFALIYLGFALIVILAAVWLGLWFAERLARPVGRLAGAAQRLGAGDFDVQVREEQGDDEIAMLGRVFNRMTRQVKRQRDALIEANEETERRRRLIDSILSGVTAGIVGLDAEGRIEMMNAAAIELLALDRAPWADVPIRAAVPEFADLFDRLDAGSQPAVQGEVRISRKAREETLLVRIASRMGAGGSVEGYVVSFDDVTDLVTAQRMAAWGDVARRIAHEIKNPLTPIQLSAERLRRKFAPMVGEDRAALESYADVIIRQTGDLRRIVDEFSKFARMPAPERREADLMELIRGAVLLQEGARPDISWRIEAAEDRLDSVIDPTLIAQALTNLLKNATEAIDARLEKGVPDGAPPEIRVLVSAADGAVLIQIQDNGIGLPEERGRLFEPYVTTRAKGTGLGLSIVKKIIEDHQGQLDLMEAPPFAAGAVPGAEARILLPLGAAGASSLPARGAA
jgi:two-component system nitrogen regulation sensor histidine kinase NtrY